MKKCAFMAFGKTHLFQMEKSPFFSPYEAESDLFPRIKKQDVKVKAGEAKVQSKKENTENE